MFSDRCIYCNFISGTHHNELLLNVDFLKNYFFKAAVLVLLPSIIASKKLNMNDSIDQ